MPQQSRWADRLLLFTSLLSVITLAVGLAACPSQSGAVQSAFFFLSLGVFLCFVVSLDWHMKLITPIARFAKLSIGIPPLVGFWALLLLFTPHAILEYSLRTQMMRNAKNLSLTFHAVSDANKRLPADHRDANGNVLLSWRVSILPWIDYAALQSEMDLAQPWDSPKNKMILAKMPHTYESVLFPQDPGTTPWQGFVGPGTAFDPAVPNMSLSRDFTDGTGNTIFIVEAAGHVPWTKPADIAFGPNLPLPKLGGDYLAKANWPFHCTRRDPGAIVAMADGTVRFLRADIPESTLRALIVRNDGGPPEDWDPDR